jgi:Transposase DDE domain group 1
VSDGIGEHEWAPAIDMDGAQVAAVDYAPAGWPPDAYTIVRRVPIDAADISTDPRARRRRTIPAGQLTLALDGALDTVWAVSFIVTNIPVDDVDSDPAGDFDSVVDVEAWFRRRTDIEDRIRGAKHGAALRHLPSGNHQVNRVWMWAALLAGKLSMLLQALTGLVTDGRAHGERLRRELLTIPARVIRHARRLELRLPPGPQILPEVLARLRALPCGCRERCHGPELGRCSGAGPQAGNLRRGRRLPADRIRHGGGRPIRSAGGGPRDRR